MAGWYILLVLTGIFFLAVQFVLLPKILVRLRYGAVPPRGRGRETLRESDGKSVLYDAPSDVSHVIPQYTLSERNGEKSMQCRVNGNVRAVSYDVALFNGYGEVFKVLNVRKDAVHSGYAGEIALPPETEYISIYLPAAEGVRRSISAPSGKNSESALSHLYHGVCAFGIPFRMPHVHQRRAYFRRVVCRRVPPNERLFRLGFEHEPGRRGGGHPVRFNSFQSKKP